MVIKAECTIDLDEKRRVWSEVSVADIGLNDISTACEAAADAAADGALRAYEKARSRHSSEPEVALRGMGDID